MDKFYFSILTLLLFFACQSQKKHELNPEILASLGGKYQMEFSQAANDFKNQIGADSTNVEARLGLAETNIILYIFGFKSREETLPEARTAYQQARGLDSLSSEIHRLSGMLQFLNWNWEGAQAALVKAIEKNPENLNARHWYSLWLVAMNRFEEAMAQHDTISTMDAAGDHLIGRASLLYFQYRFEEMKPLMDRTIAIDSTLPWAYDWLGMAYNGLDEHEDAIETYFKAFELSDGTVEVGGGLGHALGEAGEVELAKKMADFYANAAKENYLPPVQRSFIHLGIGDYEGAIKLLEQAFEEQSWFLIFIQVEHWYDPIRKDERFIDIMNRMNFPNQEL